MKIDTIILSGGSTKGISFLGTFNYLIENKYIDRINIISFFTDFFYLLTQGKIFI